MATVKKDPSRKLTPWVVRWRDEQGKQRKRRFARKVDADRFRSELEHTRGHANAAMTLNVYAHLWPDDEDRSRDAVDAVLRRSNVPTICPAEET